MPLKMTYSLGLCCMNTTLKNKNLLYIVVENNVRIIDERH